MLHKGESAYIMKKERFIFWKQLNRLMSKRDKKLLWLLLVASIGVSIIETVSLTAMMFFISTVTSFDFIESRYYFKYVKTFWRDISPLNFALILGTVVTIGYIFRTIISIAHTYLMTKFSYANSRRHILDGYNNFLNFHYQDFVVKNSASVGAAIFSYAGMLTQINLALLAIATELFTIVTIYTLLFWMSWRMTLGLTVILCLLAYGIIKFFSDKIAYAGKMSIHFSIEKDKTYSESLGNFKLIKLHCNSDVFIERMTNAQIGLSKTGVLNTLLQNTPRYILETIGFLIMVGMIFYILFVYQDTRYVIPLVSMYALAFYRFLPSINKILSSYNMIVFNKHILAPLYSFLHLPREYLGDKPISFKKSISLEDITFGYVSDKNVLSRVNLTINKGERVAFIGESGAGKSTLVDLIIGLYVPLHGEVLIDDDTLNHGNMVSWRSKVGYIPQSIYLFDGTIAENITFGRPHDEQRVVNALVKANIYDFLLTQQGLETRVGEGGIKLSGGQKQRIAIARALYNNPEILVLDEATSALDHETEGRIMEEIYNIGRETTLLIVAHRLSTVLRCEKIYRIEKGYVYSVEKHDLERVHIEHLKQKNAKQRVVA